MPNYVNPDAPRRQFIAGAVCPRCGEMDKTVLLRLEGGAQRRECVSCGFAEDIDDTPVEELPTRVNSPQSEASADPDVVPVRIIDPSDG